MPGRLRNSDKRKTSYSYWTATDEKAARPIKYGTPPKTYPYSSSPGKDSPEVWIWGCLRENVEIFAAELGIAASDLAARVDRLDSVFDSAPDRPSEITKRKLASLGDEVGWSVPDICRIVSRREADREDSEIQPLIENLQDAVEKWRSP